MSGFVRTITGDVEAAHAFLGRCDAHEHVILRGRFIAEHYPELLLDSEPAAAADLAAFR